MSGISQDSIDLAVLRLFRRCAVSNGGTRVLYAQLERRWLETGLRRDDLQRAITRLEHRLCLRVIRDSDPGPDVELLGSGWRRMAPELLSPGAWIAVRMSILQLYRAQRRQVGTSSSSSRRRSDRL